MFVDFTMAQCNLIAVQVELVLHESSSHSWVLYHEIPGKFAQLERKAALTRCGACVLTWAVPLCLAGSCSTFTSTHKELREAARRGKPGEPPQQEKLQHNWC